MSYFEEDEKLREDLKVLTVAHDQVALSVSRLTTVSRGQTLLLCFLCLSQLMLWMIVGDLS